MWFIARVLAHRATRQTEIVLAHDKAGSRHQIALFLR
jgi:hypothetical protein